jgi:MFS family permease
MLFYAGLAAVVLGTVSGMFPLWRSRTLSPASIQRRCFWTGSIGGPLLMFVSQLPDWRSGLFVALATLSVLVLVAYRFTSHLKIGGRIYEYMRDPRRPDPPPALANADE